MFLDLKEIQKHKCKCGKPSVRFHPLTEGGFCCKDCYLMATSQFNRLNGQRCEICNEVLFEGKCVNADCRSNEKSYPKKFNF